MTTSTLRIAWRNLWRNTRRTGLALAAIGLSVALVLAYDSILRGYGDWLLETLTGPMMGHAQVHAVGWRKDRAMDRTLGKASHLVDALARDTRIATVTSRVYAPALAALAEEGFAVVAIGVDPQAETGPARLLDSATPAFGGKRILMGRPLATLMGVKVGAAVALVGQGADGSLANDLYTVVGLVDTPLDLVNRQGVILDLVEAQTLFSMPDEVHEIVVHARDPEQAEAVAATVAARPEFADTEVLDWKRLAPEMVSLVELVQVAWVFVLGLVFIAAAAGVANTMLMATFERTREFGMLLALGSRPGRIVRMILAESVALGLIGSALGAGIGLAAVLLTHESGIDYAALTGGGPTAISFAGLRWSLRLYPTLAAIDIIRVVGAVVVTSVLASIWPAMRVARLHPASALRA